MVGGEPGPDWTEDVANAATKRHREEQLKAEQHVRCPSCGRSDAYGPNPYTVGSVVRLMSGGPMMTVKHKGYTCDVIKHIVQVQTQWFTKEGNLVEGLFKPECLTGLQAESDVSIAASMSKSHARELVDEAKHRR